MLMQYAYMLQFILFLFPISVLTVFYALETFEWDSL